MGVANAINVLPIVVSRQTETGSLADTKASLSETRAHLTGKPSA